MRAALTREAAAYHFLTDAFTTGTCARRSHRSATATTFSVLAAFAGSHHD
jgi:hypothetical protein